MRHARRGGSYLRVADPEWSDPLSGEYSRVRGGRWNPPEGFDVVYLNADVDVARAQVRRKLAPLAIRPEDLDPARAPVLVATEVPEAPYVDAVSGAGLRSLGLPETYPQDADGETVDHTTCQPIGTAAEKAGEPGIVARSAAELPSPGEELAYFGDERLRPGERRGFEEWFWPGSAVG
ncbi:MAG TPA: RES family NAD+ phosphorylase [Solirubrobacterales bacterium]|nr:RES family NAD+ phosphorylase [Solirubrobacterales bacterium]